MNSKTATTGFDGIIDHSFQKKMAKNAVSVFYLHSIQQKSHFHTTLPLWAQRTICTLKPSDVSTSEPFAVICVVLAPPAGED